MQRAPESFRQGGKHVVNRSDCREGYRPAEHDRVVFEQFSAERQHDQHYGDGVQQHQHGDGILDNRVKAEVCENKGHGAERYRPRLIRRPILEQCAEGLGTAGYEADRRLEAGKRDSRGEDDKAGISEVIPRYLREGHSAVCRSGQCAPALRTDDGDGNVYQRHEQAAHHARAHRAAGYCARLLHAEVAYDLNDDDAEGEACQRVHGVIALKEAGEKRLRRVFPLRHNIRDGGGRMQHGGDYEHRQKQQEAWVEHLAHPHENLSRPQREKQHGGEERQ